MTLRNFSRVLVTGGAGFIARALYARALEEDWATRFYPVSRDDGKLRAVLERFPNVDQVRRLDVEDHHLVHATVSEIAPDMIIHAAASKYVDVSEANAWDTIRTNVTGSANVASIAHQLAVPVSIAISTDKAAMPVNTYGASKFVMERIWQEADRWHPDRRFVVARYGNVIGSTGSALPRMREQAQKGEPVTVTNPDMTRFWMSPSEAVDTIIATAEAPGGTVTIPTSIRSSSLLVAVHAAVGDMNLVTIGERAGEKGDECLLTENEHRRAGPGGRYLRLYPPTHPNFEDSEDLRALTSDAPWAGFWSSGEIADVLLEAAKV